MPKKNIKAEETVSEAKLYTTLEREASAEFIERKSVFIGYARPVKSEAEAVEFIATIRKKHSDATHNVYAYVISGGSTARFSDDGEPSGTAGMPVLDVIKKSGVTDCCVVVTRYFGGILLGAGGLVRAYATGAKIALEAAHIVTYEAYTEFLIKCDYSSYQKINFELSKYNILTDSSDFGSDVVLRLGIKSTLFEEFSSKLAEMFAGRIIPEITGERFDFR